MFNDISSELVATMYYNVAQNNATSQKVLRTVPHVNVREIVAAIQNFSNNDVQQLAVHFGGKPFTSLDNRVESIYSKLTNKVDPFSITEELLSCGYFVSQMTQPNTSTQACICLLQTLIESHRKQDRQKIDKVLVELFHTKDQKPTIHLLTDQLNVPVTTDDIDKWINTH